MTPDIKALTFINDKLNKLKREFRIRQEKNLVFLN